LIQITGVKLTADFLYLGVAADLSHINTNSTVTGYDPTPSGLRDALNGAEIVLIPAGVPRKPGMTRDGMMTSLFFSLIT
jgi:malate dehydrogenase